MSNMVERVARASFKCWRGHMTKLGHHMDRGMTFEDMTDDEREFEMMNAKAMIAAMRDPTEEMSTTAIMLSSDSTYDEIYKAYIDAALKE